MGNLSRRAFVELSLGAAAAASFAPAMASAQQCVTGGLPSFLPNSLTVDCASQRNFSAFRQYSDYLGLAGAVSMTYVRGSYGAYPAGSLFLFPWLKKKGQLLTGKTWPAMVPISGTQVVNSSPIANAGLPLDEAFLRFKLQAPWASFIGFQVDTPYPASQAQRPWYTNVDKLADGNGVGIGWTSHNLNQSFFGGSRWIPNTEACNGNAWRKLILAAVSQASVPAC